MVGLRRLFKAQSGKSFSLVKKGNDPEGPSQYCIILSQAWSNIPDWNAANVEYRWLFPYFIENLILVKLTKPYVMTSKHI